MEDNNIISNPQQQDDDNDKLVEEEEEEAWKREVHDYYDNSNCDTNKTTTASITTKDDNDDNDDDDDKQKYENWPLRDIREPHPNDVIFGRGGGTNHHVGNKRYRALIEKHKDEYNAAKRLDKPLIALHIIKRWRESSPGGAPGRFIKQDSKTHLWYDVGDIKARKKTSQALREKPKVNTGLSSYQKKKLLLQKQKQEEHEQQTKEQTQEKENLTMKKSNDEESCSSYEEKGTAAAPIEIQKTVPENHHQCHNEQGEQVVFSMEEYLWEEAIEKIQHSAVEDIATTNNEGKSASIMMVNELCGGGTNTTGATKVLETFTLDNDGGSLNKIGCSPLSSSSANNDNDDNNTMPPPPPPPPPDELSFPMLSSFSAIPISSMSSLLGGDRIIDSHSTGGGRKMVADEQQQPPPEAVTVVKRITSHDNETLETKPYLKMTTDDEEDRAQGNSSSATGTGEVCCFSSVKRTALNNRDRSLLSNRLKERYLPTPAAAAAGTAAALQQQNNNEIFQKKQQHFAAANVFNTDKEIRALSTATKQMHLDNTTAATEEEHNINNNNIAIMTIPQPPPASPVSDEERLSTADALLSEFVQDELPTTPATPAAPTPSPAKPPKTTTVPEKPLDWHKETSFSAWLDEDPSLVSTLLGPPQQDGSKADQSPLVRAQS